MRVFTFPPSWYKYYFIIYRSFQYKAAKSLQPIPQHKVLIFRSWNHFWKKWGNMCSSTYQFSLSSPDIASNFWLINYLSTLINWWLWLKLRLYSGCLASSTSRVRATYVMYLWRVTDCDSWSMETIQGVFFDLKPTADL